MLAFPDVQILDVVGPLQMFAGANDELSAQAYSIEIAAPIAGPFKTSSGIQLVADLGFRQLSNARLSRVDTIIAAGGNLGVHAALEEGHLPALLRRAHGRARRVASVCSGAFFLAAAGLLDGRRAATHWRSVDALRRFRPQVVVDSDAIHIQDGDIWTSAGVTAGIDLALALIEADHGRAVALAIARRHVVFRIRPGGQSQFSAELAGQAACNARLAKLTALISGHPERAWHTEALASAAGVSLRSLSRLFRRELNLSPAAFVERARVDNARRALVESDACVEAIARKCGFGSARRMDRAFARTIATTPTAFRQRFRANGGPS